VYWRRQIPPLFADGRWLVKLRKILTSTNFESGECKFVSGRSADTAAISRTVGNLGGLWKNVAYKVLKGEDGRYARADLKPRWVFSSLVCSHASF
jgi:hypothetical protein